ncbi:glycosyltransferase [Ohtaekwangia sp.]|uniref:glycosyltransferase n=1 Tax=Ohtaekwangia sp. TaxID=2066019 RepID=UPI002FDCE3BA
MKILMITPWYPDKESPNSGAFIRSQAETLSKDHDVVVIAAKVNYRKFGLYTYHHETSQYGKVTEHRLTIYKSLPVYNQLNAWFIMLRYSRKVAREFKPDVIHASIGYPGAYWGYLLKRYTGAPYILQEHTRVKNNFRSYFHRQLTLAGLRKADALVAVGTRLATELKSLLHRDINVIPNVVEVERYRYDHRPQTTVMQIGFLGGMNTAVKGLDILLQAIAGIQKDFVLHIGGTGSKEEEYKAQAEQLGIASKCKFYGFIPYNDIPQWMEQLHFFVCSSRYETFCVALVEAMASGVPVVSTCCGGPEDFVNEGNGLLVENENIAALREGIRHMMQTHQQYNPQAIAIYASDNFSRQSFLTRIEKLYHEVIERAKR